MKSTLTVRPLRQWQRGGSHGVVQAVRGSGKTELGITALAAAVEQGRQSLVVVCDAEAAERWRLLLVEGLPKATISASGSDLADSADVVIADANEHIRFLQTGARRSGLLVVDDFHLMSASDLGALTPNRFEQKLGLADYTAGFVSSRLAREFGAVIIGCDYTRARRDGHLAPLRLLLVGVPFKTDELKRYSQHNDAVTRARSELSRRYRCRVNTEDNFEMDARRLADGPASDAGTQTARRYGASLADRRDAVDECIGKTFALREFSQMLEASGRTLVFTETMRSASALAEAILEEGVLAAPFSAALDAGDRRELESSFNSGAVRVLTVPSELDELTATPDATTAVLATSSRSHHSMLHRMSRIVGTRSSALPTTVVVLYMKGSFEDPENADPNTYLGELTSAASEVVSTDVGGAAAKLAQWLGSVESTDAHQGVAERDNRALEELAFRIVDDGPVSNVAGDAEALRELLRRTTDSVTMDEVDRVLRSLSILDEREVAIVIARYGLDGDEPRTYPQIAAQVGVSAGRVSQLETAAVQKLVPSYDGHAR